MLRFFTGSRNSDKKNNAASDAFRKNMKGNTEFKKTEAEKFEELLDARMVKMMNDYAEGNKTKTFALPGTKKEEGPKPLSKNAKSLFEKLARQKLMNDMKKQQKREAAFKAEKKKEAKDKAYQEKQQENQKAASQTSNTRNDAWFWGES